MSLLLDALHRASKDKEKIASAAIVPAPVVSEPALVEPDPAKTWQLTADFPDLQAPEPSPPEPRLAAETSAMASPGAHKLELEPVPKSAFEPELAFVPTPSPSPVPGFFPKPVEQADMAKLLAGKSTPAKVNAPSPEVATIVKPAVVSPPTEKAAAKISAPAPASADRAAQDIRRAYASTTPSNSGGRRRLIILGSVAGVLALVIGSVFFGIWGDPEKILGLSGQSSLATPALTQPPALAASQPQEAVPSMPVAAVTSVQVLPVESSPKSSLEAGTIRGVAAEQTRMPTNSAKLPVKRATAAAVAARGAVEPVPGVPSGDLASQSGGPKNHMATRTNGAQALELGYAALIEGRFDNAVQAYAQALVTNPDERDALLGMAYIHHQEGRREQAQENYRKVLRQDPANATAQSGLLALDSLSDTTLTAGRARELAYRQPESAAAMASLGSAFVRDGLLADAALAFAKAQAIEPGNPLHAYNHAVALDRLGQFGAALNQYEAVMKLWGGSAVAVRVFQIETVRQRVAQLRQSIGNPGENAK